MAKHKDLDINTIKSEVEAQSELPITNSEEEMEGFGPDENTKSVKLDADLSAVETNLDKKYNKGSVHSRSRSRMPEKQLFQFAEYHSQEAERIGYSNYSYWKSVWRNFIKKKTAVCMAIVFILPPCSCVAAAPERGWS